MSWRMLAHTAHFDAIPNSHSGVHQMWVLRSPHDRLRPRREALEAEREQEDHTAEDSGSVGLATTMGGEEGAAWHSNLPEPTIVREADLPREADDPMIGQVLSGLYKVDRRIGQGGMGTVYMAVHIHLNKPFAVKVLSEKVAANKQAVDRLLIEAQTASSIDHDNIVDVVSFDTTDDGRVFLVMEMLEGFSLGDVIEEGPMKLERALPIVYQICEALEAAHARGVIHRDLKPENIFIVRKRDADFVKVLDFGISKVKSAEAEEVRMTKTGQLVGTPLYMSPEQARGDIDVDRHADIYAVGVILYEMLTGRPPFEGGNYFQLLWKHGNETPQSSRRLRSDIPKALDAVIMRTLEKKPEDRYDSMAALEAALIAAVPDIGVHPDRLISLPPMAPVPARSGSKVRAMMIGGAIVLGIGAALFFGRTVPPAPEIVETAPQPREAIAEPPAEIPPGVEAPVAASVHFDSQPSGAEVHHGDVILGVTPFDATLPTGIVLNVRYQLAGYRDASTEVLPVEGARVTKRLRRRIAAPMSNMNLPIPRMTL